MVAAGCWSHGAQENACEEGDGEGEGESELHRGVGRDGRESKAAQHWETVRCSTILNVVKYWTVWCRYLKAQGKMKPEEKKASKRGNTLQKGSKKQPRISQGGGKNLDGRLKKDKKNTTQKSKRDKIGGAKTGRVARIRAIRGKSGKK